MFEDRATADADALAVATAGSDRRECADPIRLKRKRNRDRTTTVSREAPSVRLPATNGPGSARRMLAVRRGPVEEGSLQSLHLNPLYLAGSRQSSSPL
jgi:hypothetical protein